MSFTNVPISHQSDSKPSFKESNNMEGRDHGEAAGDPSNPIHLEDEAIELEIYNKRYG